MAINIEKTSNKTVEKTDAIENIKMLIHSLNNLVGSANPA